jgi:hypothetical protein
LRLRRHLRLVLRRWWDAGNVAVGNLGRYMPILLNELGAQPKRQYLLLTALREVCPGPHG